MTDHEIAELERLLGKATKAPWTVEDPLGPNILSVIANGSGPVYDWCHVAQLSVETPDDPSDIPIIEQEANAKLIVAMRNALPSLLTSLKEARAEVERLNRCLNALATGRIYHKDRPQR